MYCQKIRLFVLLQTHIFSYWFLEIRDRSKDITRTNNVKLLNYVEAIVIKNVPDMILITI